MSLNPSFQMHLEYEPFQATAKSVNEGACLLQLGTPGSFFSEVTLYFPADKLEQVQRIADALNEISKPAEAPASPIAA